MFPGDDKREFWERVKIRNKNTANTLKIIGLPEYEAAEAFVDLDDLVDYDEFWANVNVDNLLFLNLYFLFNFNFI